MERGAAWRSVPAPVRPWAAHRALARRTPAAQRTERERSAASQPVASVLDPQHAAHRARCAASMLRPANMVSGAGTKTAVPVGWAPPAATPPPPPRRPPFQTGHWAPALAREVEARTARAPADAPLPPYRGLGQPDA